MRLAIAVMLCCSCGGAAPPIGAMPWVRGFAPVASADVETGSAAERLAGLVGVPSDGGYGALEVSFPAAGEDAAWTVLASYQQGLVVVDRHDHVLGKVRGLDPTGSSDDLVALAVGDGGLGSPLVLVVASRGGHRESSMVLDVYSLGDDGHLDRVFEGDVEEHDDDVSWAGSVLFSPGRLLYRAPRSERARSWTFDARRRRYVVNPSL